MSTALALRSLALARRAAATALPHPALADGPASAVTARELLAGPPASHLPPIASQHPGALRRPPRAPLGGSAALPAHCHHPLPPLAAAAPPPGCCWRTAALV